MASVLDKRLLWITGKGGVGKSTVAAAIGLAAAARGKRTIVCEVAEQERLSRLFRSEGVGPGGETRLTDDLYATTIDPRKALSEWLATQIGGALAKLLGSSDGFQYFVAAAPGAKELVSTTKAWELTQERRWDKKAGSGYDLVVVDAPASGHGVSMLRTPRTFADLARVGPVHSQAKKVDQFLLDEDATGYAAVALAEEMPVTETLELDANLDAQLGRRFEVMIVNAVYPRRFTAEQLEQVRAAAGDGDSPASPLTGAARAASAEHHRQRGQESQLRRLRRAADVPVVTLPYLFEPELDLDDVERLAAELERKL